MDDRLEIASRIMAALYAATPPDAEWGAPESAAAFSLDCADALIEADEPRRLREAREAGEIEKQMEEARREHQRDLREAQLAAEPDAKIRLMKEATGVLNGEPDRNMLAYWGDQSSGFARRNWHRLLPPPSVAYLKRKGWDDVTAEEFSRLAIASDEGPAVLIRNILVRAGILA